ncbi:hypothetical protein [Teredinibacter turnerae]|uniref:hypothetical protein n=1 Tax=Teredinibacter turnerae TaxID=2426 RepID=UPI0005F88500|nr:hypothetical protein [Teredinibacter turnerae]
MFRIFFTCALVFLSMQVSANGVGLTIKSVYYCQDDFSMLMSNGERWVIKKSVVGEYKMNHMVSIALFMAASEKKTANIFPGPPEEWCGNDNTRPISFISFVN